MFRWVPPARIRPIAIAVVRDRERLLVMEGHDVDAGTTFYRPLGGGIDFGERGAAAVVREFREELGVELEQIRQLGVIENLYTLHGATGHEIVFVYAAALVDRSLCDRETLEIAEDNGGTSYAKWIALAEIRSGAHRLVPDGLLELLTSSTPGSPSDRNLPA